MRTGLEFLPGEKEHEPSKPGSGEARSHITSISQSISAGQANETTRLPEPGPPIESRQYKGYHHLHPNWQLNRAAES